MSVFEVPQTAVVAVAELGVSEDLIFATPHIRRATPEFAHECGGSLVAAFLEAAQDAGQIHGNSLFMCQPTDFRDSAYPKAPRWHFDFPQGIETTTDEDFMKGVFGCTGLIACMFEVECHPNDVGTTFVQGGTIQLDMTQRDTRLEYVPQQSIASNAHAGLMYWWHPQVEQQLRSKNGLHTVSIRPNTAYAYGSNNIHMAPQMHSDIGRRMIMRINTPTGDRSKPEAQNLLIDPNDPNAAHYVFRSDPKTGGWQRSRV